jgi:hypothetical protein
MSGPGGSLVISARAPGVDALLGVVACRAYRIRPGARAAPLDEPVEIPGGVVFAPSANAGEGARDRFVADAPEVELSKVLTDVILTGSGHARAPVTSLDTALELGAARKAVRVIGERRVEVRAGGQLSFSAPERFTAMPITWDLAYGGRDVEAEKRIFADLRVLSAGRRDVALERAVQLYYARNGSGRGYRLDLERARLDGLPAPCLEDPTDPVTPDRLLSERTTDWIDRPVAACYEPIDVFTFPRSAFGMRPAYDDPARPIHELSTGAVLRDDLTRPLSLASPGARIYNMAPSGLAVCRLRGDERARLWNLHRDHALLEIGLPDDEPELTLEVPGVGARPLAARLGTVRIEPDADRLVLTWAGSMPVAARFPDEMVASMRHAVRWKRKAATA